MRIRYLIPAASMSLVLLLFVGCGDEQADIQALSRYTPEILVDETLARYKAAVKANRDGGVESKASKGKAGGSETKGDDDKIAAAVAKYGEEVRSRDSPGTSKGMSVTAILDGVPKKVKLIEGTPPEQVYAKLDEAIDYDPELTAEEKDAFKDGLFEARKKAQPQ